MIINMHPGTITCAILLALTSFCEPIILEAQVVYETKYRHEADAVLYKVLYPSQADIRVFKAEYQNEADPEIGIWHMTRYRAQAEWKIYWTPYRNEADCTVYFTPYKSQANRNACFYQFRRDQEKKEKQ